MIERYMIELHDFDRTADRAARIYAGLIFYACASAQSPSGSAATRHSGQAGRISASAGATNAFEIYGRAYDTIAES